MSHLTICEKPKRFCVQATTTHPFFKGSIIINIRGTRIIFKKPTIDYMGKVINPTKHKKYDIYQFGINNGDIKLGKYEFSEDSTEEKIVVDIEFN